jgi:hypothetical protein
MVAREPRSRTLLTAASDAVQEYCRRDFASTAYDELYSGTLSGSLISHAQHSPAGDRLPPSQLNHQQTGEGRR